MSKGLYLGVNHQADYCVSCGHHFIGDDKIDNGTCPVCGSDDIVKVRRIRSFVPLIDIGWSQKTLLIAGNSRKILLNQQSVI